MRVGVTGGEGFIGTHVCARLRADGHAVSVLDRWAGYREHAGRFLGDIRDAATVDEFVAHCDGVIHLAGVLGTQETIANPRPAVETNIIGGLNVLEAVAHHRVRAVYIAVGNHWMNNPYSITKTAVERLCWFYNAERGTKVAVVRALNAYGPGQAAPKPYGSSPVRKIVPTFACQALNGDPVEVYGDGSQVMDLVHVRDVAEALVRALTMDHGVYDKPFEIGSGRDTTVAYIAKTVTAKAALLTGSEATIEYQPMRPGEPEHAVVVGKPATLMPLTMPPLTPLDEGLDETINYFAAL